MKSQSILQNLETAENKHGETHKILETGKRPEENNNNLKNNQIYNEDFGPRHSFVYTNEKDNVIGKKQIGYGSGFIYIIILSLIIIISKTCGKRNLHIRALIKIMILQTKLCIECKIYTKIRPILKKFRKLQ